MRWVSKHPPLYVSEGDIWVKEPEYTTWRADLELKAWVFDEEELDLEIPNQAIPFPPKTKVLDGRSTTSISAKRISTQKTRT